MVSIVVPVYNMAQYLERSVNSLLKQTYKDIEIILVDDGSTDECPRICDDFANKYDIIRTVHKENGGLSSARNCGIENAKGEFIIFPDPDDWVSEDYIMDLVFLNEQFQTQLEVSSYYIVDEKSQIENNICHSNVVLSKNEAVKSMLIGGGINGFAWNKLYHMDIIVNNGLRFDEELGMAQDLHFAVRYVLLCDKISLSNKPTYYYFQHTGGVTNPKAKLTPRKKSGLKTYEKLLDIVHNDCPESEPLIHSTIANMSMQFIYIYYNSKMDDKEFLNILRTNVKENKSYFLSNKYYKKSHKILGTFAFINPKLYYLLRKVLGR